MSLFGGETYDDNQDRDRLYSQLLKVKEYMWGRTWSTLAQISAATGYPEASISARIRDLRKKRFGSYDAPGRRKKAGKGTWEYRLLAPKEPEPSDNGTEWLL